MARLTRIIFPAFILVLLIFIFFWVFLGNKQDKTLKGMVNFPFARPQELRGWEEKIFKGKVTYSIKKGVDGPYLNASSKNAASGLLHWLKVNPRKFPMISWQWKVVKFPTRIPGAFQENWWVEKNDCAARFYVIFPRFPFFRLQCLEYVWDEDLAKETIITNPNFKNLRIIVVESGRENLGKWVSIERNVYEDFRKCFGSNSGNIGGIAIMTDSDNTASTAQAQYKNIEVGYAK